MKLGILTCIWKRHELAALTMNANLAAATEAGIEVTPIAVLSEDGFNQISVPGWGFVLAENSPLGAKWNAGVVAFKDLDVDAVMIVGSDDLLSEELFEKVKLAFEDGADWFGVRGCYVYHGASGRVRRFEGYPKGSKRYGETIGTCRTFSKNYLIAHRWRLWPDELSAGLDAASNPAKGNWNGRTQDVGMILDVKAYPLVDMGKFWTTEGKDVEAAPILAKFGSAAFALRALCDPVARAERVFPMCVKQPFLSACLMVKNEHATIAETLVSLRGVADEVLVLDTGSDDGTIEIAEAYGAKVRKVLAPEPFDFGKWRNESIKEAQGTWVLILDGDEWLTRKDSLRNALEAVPEDVDALAIPHALLGKVRAAEGAAPIVRFLRGDKVRNETIRYVYPNQHQLVGAEKVQILANGPYTVEPMEDPSVSAERTILAMNKMLESATGKQVLDAGAAPALGGRQKEKEHALFYLARNWALLASGLEQELNKLRAQPPEERVGIDELAGKTRLAYEKASVYAGFLVDLNPKRAEAWLTLIACVERSRGLEFVTPIVQAAGRHHPKLRDLRWWALRIAAVGLAQLLHEPDEYPLVPSRQGYYGPKLPEIGNFLMMKLAAPPGFDDEG